MRSRTLALALLCALVLPAGALAQDTAPEKVDIKRVAKKLDNLYRSETSKAVMTMQIVTPDYERTLKLEMTTRGQDDTLIRILSPRKERGISTLKRGNEMWNYLPKVKKVVRVPPSMMTSSWMGSDVTNDDLVRDSSWERDYVVTQVEAPAGEFCLKFVPRKDAAITWSKVMTCFDARLELPKRQEFYDEKGNKVREVVMDQFKKVDGRIMPTRTRVTPLSADKKGRSTVMTYDALSFDMEIPENTFSMANLRRAK